MIKRDTTTCDACGKAVLDGIVRAGILADDSAKQVESIMFESHKSRDERTVIEIDEC